VVRIEEMWCDAMFELPRGFSNLGNASRTEVGREYCNASSLKARRTSYSLSK
jgi:hypothetical protein